MVHEHAVGEFVGAAGSRGPFWVAGPLDPRKKHTVPICAAKIRENVLGGSASREPN